MRVPYTFFVKRDWDYFFSWNVIYVFLFIRDSWLPIFDFCVNVNSLNVFTWMHFAFLNPGGAQDNQLVLENTLHVLPTGSCTFRPFKKYKSYIMFNFLFKKKTE